MTQLISRLLLAVSLALSLGACAADASDDQRSEGASLRGGEAPLTAAMDLCGAAFQCTLYGPDEGPIGPVRTASFGSDENCVLTDRVGETASSPRTLRTAAACSTTIRPLGRSLGRPSRR